MTAPKRNETEHYATHSDLTKLRTELKEDFQAGFAQLAAKLDRIDERSADKGKTNWANVIAAVSLFLFIMGMAAALVNNQFSSTHAQIATQADYFEKIRGEVTNRLDDKIAVNTAAHEQSVKLVESGFKKLDEVLQREMRLLDDILQREMGLHVKRLDELVKTAEVHSQQRHDLQQEQIERLRDELFNKLQVTPSDVLNEVKKLQGNQGG